MKTMKLLFLAAVAAISFLSLRNARDVLSSLGLTHEMASGSIVANLTGAERFSLPYLKIAPEILTGDKAGAAREVCAYIKTYCESSEFAAEHEKYRQSKKPTEEEIPQFDAESLKEMKESAKSWDEMAQNKSFPKEQRDEYKKWAEDIRATIARTEDPTPRLTDWKNNFPEDPTLSVKRGLERYLALVKTVDFDATLTQPDKYGIKKFENPAYESKSPQWKAIYRAGREVNQVATEFAQQWLASGIKTGQPFSAPVAKMQPDTKQQVEEGTPRAGAAQQDNSDESDSSAEGNDQAEKKESTVTKAKGLIRSLKNQINKLPQ